MTKETSGPGVPDQAGTDSHLDESAEAMPLPDPALRRLDPFVGTWELTGQIEGMEEPTIRGMTTFEWLPGGFFLKQHMKMDFGGFVQIDSTELVGYDAETETYPSHVYANLSPVPLPYRWHFEGDELVITVSYGPLDATCRGGINEDGSFHAAWAPNPGADPQANVPYRIWGSRVD